MPVSFRSGGTSLSGQASTAGAAARHPPPLPRHRGPRRGPAGARPARRDRPAGQRAAGQVRAPAGTGPGQRGGLHDGRGDRRQLQRHVLRHRIQRLQHHRVRRARAAERHRPRHRRARRRRAAAGARAADCGRAWPPCATGYAATRRRSRTIRRQYAIKNTMGYGLNAFTDYDRPVDILLHLIVGSEGTLAFVAEAVLRTVPVKPHVATGMLYFSSLRDAAGALPGLLGSGPATRRAARRRLPARRPAGPGRGRGAAGPDRPRPCRPPGGVPGGDAGGARGQAHRLARSSPPGCRSPGRPCSATTRAAVTPCGTSARACTPPSRKAGPPGPPRCSRTSPSRSTGCGPPARG